MLVADVRLDNREELLRALTDSPAQFREQSDSAILLQALLAWGDTALERILGGYAFAFHDARERRTLLARDPAGEKPLHYAWRDGLFRFASMPGGLVSQQRQQFDLEMLAGRLASPPAPPGRTCFQGVSALLAGHKLVVSPSGAIESDFWQPSFRPTVTDTSELIEEFRERLDAAVSARLRSGSPAVASQLSSGYDSNAVTSTASLLAGDRQVMAITAVPAPGLPQLLPMNRIGDESGYAALTAKLHGIEHHVVYDQASLLAPLAAPGQPFQEPINNLINHGWWLKVLEVARERGSSVLLCGIMGNITLSYGGVAVLPYLVRGGHWRSWWREARAAVAKNRNRWRGVLMTSFEPHLPPSLMSAIRRGVQGSPAPGRFCFVRSHLLQEAPRVASAANADLPDARLHWYRKSDPGMLNKSLLALTGVDQRDPTSDRRFTEFCLSLPPEQLLRDGEFRPLARRALADRVPKEVLNLPVRGYQGADWFARLHRAEAEQLMEEIAASPSASELLDLGEMRRGIEDWPTPDRDNHEIVFAFGRALTNALATGKFIADIERDPSHLAA